LSNKEKKLGKTIYSSTLNNTTIICILGNNHARDCGMSAEATVELKNVGVDYKKAGKTFAALKDLNLNVGKGEFVSVVGPSNCGKTVLLRLIAGFESPTTGQALFEGQPISGADYRRGYIFQDITLFPWLTVFQNASFGLKARKVDKEKVQKVTADWLDKMGLGKFHNKFIHQLSGGMQQRVGIARVMANDPDVLLCDEPLGSLDWITRGALSNEIVQLWHETRKTVIYVTHAIEEAVFVAQRVYIMSSQPGKIVKSIDIKLPEKRWEEKGLRFNADYMQYVELVRDHVVKQGQKLGVI
jgi:ABC-type nitrate/sulfonate/bicarbonate transport system ATPase subunit